MADDRYSWLDDDAAERLLRGESVGATDGVGAPELSQLLNAAAASAAAPAGDTPLPGEEAALAAFRTARAAPAGRPAAAPAPTACATTRQRPRVVRPLRRGLAVAMTVCAIGGVAVAAGTGMLPSPFRGGGGSPEPAATVSAAVTPGTLETEEPGKVTEGASQPPGATPGDDPADPAATPTPDGGPGGTSRGPDDPRATSGGRTVAGSDGGSGDGGKNGGKDGRDRPDKGGRRPTLIGLCRDYEAGRTGGMDRDTLRALERAAGGPAKVHAFCRRYLQQQDSGGGSGAGSGSGSGGSGTSGSSGDGDGGRHGSGHSGGKGGAKGGGKGGGEDDDHSAPTPTRAATPVPGATPSPGPTPTTPAATVSATTPV